MASYKLSILLFALIFLSTTSLAKSFFAQNPIEPNFPVTPCSCQQNSLNITNIQVFVEKSSILHPKYLINVTATVQDSSHLIQYSYDLFKEDAHFASGIWGFDSQGYAGEVIVVSFHVEFQGILPRGNYKLLTTFYDSNGVSVGCGQIELTKQAHTFLGMNSEDFV